MPDDGIPQAPVAANPSELLTQRLIERAAKWPAEQHEAWMILFFAALDEVLDPEMAMTLADQAIEMGGAQAVMDAE